MALLMVLVGLTIGQRTASASVPPPLVAHFFSTPPSTQFASPAGGDGWSLAFTQTQVFNVFHHDGALEVACHEVITGSECWPVRTVTDTGPGDNGGAFVTPAHPSMYLDQSTGKLFTYVVRASDSTAGVACIDTRAALSTTNPFCGFTALSGVGEAEQDGSESLISNGVVVGGRFLAFNFVNDVQQGSENTLLCFDLALRAACANQPFAVNLGGTQMSVGSWPGANLIQDIGGHILVPVTMDGADGVACFDSQTLATCGGLWPLQPGEPVTNTGGNGSPLFPLLSSSGGAEGFCIISSNGTCFSLDGQATTAPPGLASLLAGDASASYLDWTGPVLVEGTREYVALGQNDQVDCYDAATDAECANFPLSPPDSTLIYTVNVDPYQGGCLWINSDTGSTQIWNFDAETGGPCQASSFTVNSADVVSGSPSCLPAQFQKLTVVGPADAVGAASRVQVLAPDGSVVETLSPTSVGSGQFSLGNLSTTSIGGLPQFAISVPSATGSGAIQTDLTWTPPNPSCFANVPYVAMGDSYSSGEGLASKAPQYLAPSNTDTCHRAANAYPEMVAADLHQSAATSSWFVACSGATSGDPTLASSEDQTFVSGNPEKSVLGGVTSSGTVVEPSQLGVLNPGTQEISMSIGGNDTGFANVAVDCMQLQNLFTFHHVVTVHQTYVMPDLGTLFQAFSGGLEPCAQALASASWVTGGDAQSAPLTGALVATYEAVLSAAPNARLTIVDYPELLTPKSLGNSAFCQLTGASPPIPLAVASIGLVSDVGHLGFTSATQASIVALQARATQDIAAAVAQVRSDPTFAGRIALVDVNPSSKVKAISCNGATVGNADVNGIRFAVGAGVSALLSPVNWVIDWVANRVECWAHSQTACNALKKIPVTVSWFDPQKFISGGSLHPNAAFHQLEAGLIFNQMKAITFA